MLCTVCHSVADRKQTSVVKGGFQQDRDCACADPVRKEQNPEINAAGLYYWLSQ